MINVTSIYKEIKEKDPEAVYNALRGENTYLLESAEGGEKVARFSFIGFNPAAKLTIKNSRVKLETFDSALKVIKIKGRDPLEILKNIILEFQLEEKPIARFFGGFVGYFSYDFVRYFYDLNGRSRDNLKEPDCEFVLAKNNVIFDHKEKKTYLISHQFMKNGQKIDKKIVQGELDKIQNRIYSAPSVPAKNAQLSGTSKFISNIPKRKFLENVKRAKKYILEGDIFQVVLSQRLETNFTAMRTQSSSSPSSRQSRDSVADEFLVYRNLKKINPSSYMYFIDFGERKIVGSSPEMLVRVENGRVETYPIAGTRRRGRNFAEDKRLENEMKGDEKEKAEHIMLVDLGRNDIGRVAKFGSVKVEKLMAVEKYSHVQHMVSEVSGVLKNSEDEFSAFKSIFPAGTVAGAPKVRAMEIIDELEPERRGIYAGAVGYFSFTRNLDTAIAIRTIIFEKNKAYIQTGAGIVADSDPEKEYQEAINKAEAMLKALNYGK